MSGGSFDYLCLWMDHPFEKPEQLRKMAAALEHHAPHSRAAKDTRELADALEGAQARGDQLRDVWRAVEWKHSADWDEQQMREAISNYERTATESERSGERQERT